MRIIPKKSKQLTVTVQGGAQYTLTVDAEDYDRVSALELKPWPSSEIHFYHNRGTAQRPVFELLEHFILQAADNEYVELIDRSPAGAFNLRRSNLKVKSAATPVYKAPAAKGKRA